MSIVEKIRRSLFGSDEDYIDATPKLLSEIARQQKIIEEARKLGITKIPKPRKYHYKPRRKFNIFKKRL